MTAAHGDVSSLLGAWAVGACSEEEAALVAGHLAGCPACAREGRALAGAAASLAEPAAASAAAGTAETSGIAETSDTSGASTPPAALRAGVLAAARARRAPAPGVPPFGAPYAAQVSVLDVLLAELSDADWTAGVIYDWTVQDVVAHLGAIDRLLHEQILDERLESAGGEADVDARTARAIAFERTRRPQESRTAWREQAQALCADLARTWPPAGSGPGPGVQAASRDAAGVPAGGGTARGIRLRQPMPLDGALVARAFETWVHSADIAAAVGRRLPDPLPEHLHAMADLGVRVLPAALRMRGRPARMPAQGHARVVLDGPGGGEWLIPLGGDGAEAPRSVTAPLVTLRLDVMEFCLLAADRRDPGEVTADIGGDIEAGRSLLESASAFAGP